jgi:hypothetical protein
MKNLVNFLMIFSSTFLNSQIDLDSLNAELVYSGHFVKSENKKYLLGNFQRYENKQKTEFYDVCYDSSGNLSDYIGVSLVHITIDSKGRILKQIGYDSKGNYNLWDFSPIQLNTYLKDTTIQEFYNRLGKLTERKKTITDSKGRIVDVVLFDENKQFKIKEHSTYKESENTIVIELMDSNGNLTPNNSGVAVKEIKLETLESDIIEQIKFFNTNHELIDAEHSHPMATIGSSVFNPGCYYSIVKFKRANNEIKFQYYNSLGNLICEGFMDGQINIIDNK